MKKMAIVLCSVFLASTLSYAMPKPDGAKSKHHGSNKEERRAKMEEMRKDQADFEKQLDELIAKYNTSKGQDKDAIKQDVKKLISAKTDKDLVRKKEMLELQKARIDRLEGKITEIEADKEAYVDKQVDFFLSKEGQKKIEEFKENRKNRERQNDHRVPPPPPVEE